MSGFQKTVCLDFDGVIHAYTSGWQGADVVSDPPVPGAFDAIKAYIDHGFDVCIYSSRSGQELGIAAMEHWLQTRGFPLKYLDKIRFPSTKPAAWLTIDDRAIQFEGFFPEIEYIDNFKPWNKR